MWGAFPSVHMAPQIYNLLPLFGMIFAIRMEPIQHVSSEPSSTVIAEAYICNALQRGEPEAPICTIKGTDNTKCGRLPVPVPQL